MKHWQESVKLDACSYLNHYSSTSRISLSPFPPSLESLTAAHQTSILKGKSPEEIAVNYHRLLVTKGEWNAEAYLKTLKAIRAKHDVALPPLLFQSKTPTLKHDKTVKRQNAVNTKYKNITVDCEQRKAPAEIPKTPLLHPHPFTRGARVPEPSYKKIFKNAKLKRTPIEDNSFRDFLLSSPPSRRRSDGTILNQNPSEPSTEPVGRPCELMDNGINNHLLDVRQAMADRIKNKLASLSPASLANLDNIEKHYQNKRMHAVLEENLEEQLQMMKVSLKPHLVDVSAPNLLRDTGFNELKALCLTDFNSIAEFQHLFDDSRWRKKFELGQLELSDEADSLDVSDIESSESASMCSGDSLGSELDYKSRPPLPSRIPYINEVQKLGDVLFDKISLKWERAVKKNFLDLDVKPYFRQFSNEIRLRSSCPMYSDLMNLLEPYDDVYIKKYTPFRHRTFHKMEKHDRMIENKHAVKKKRRMFESRQISKAAGGKQRHIQHSEHPGPTKYPSRNQRYRLKCIMRETKRRGKEDSAFTYSKKTVAEDYANLKPIIRKKTPCKAGSVMLTESSLATASSPAATLLKPAYSMRSLEDVTESTFFLPASTKSKIRGLGSQSRVSTKIHQSRLRFTV